MSLDKTKNIILKKIDHEFVLPLAVIDSSIQMERLDGHDSEFLDVISSAKTALHTAYKNIKYLLSQKSDEKTVFELTDFINRHPGGDEVLRACGTDATTLFTSRTTKDGQSIGSGTPHSQAAQEQLDQLKLGTLAK